MTKVDQVLNAFITGDILEEKSGTFSFSCLMLDLPNDLTKEILADIEDKHVHEDGKESDPHTTVKYGLHTQDHKEVFDFCSERDCLPFDITISGFSIFENEEYDVLKLSVESKELRKLNKEVCAEFEHTDTYPDYNPHCTLAYLEKGMGSVYVKLLEEKYPNFSKTTKCDKLIFSSKSGNKNTKIFK